MTEVLKAIEGRTSKDPITAKRLSEMFSVNIRTVAEIVRQGRIEGRWICASRGNPPGYFMAKTRREFEEFSKSGKREAVSYLSLHRKMMQVETNQITLFEV